MVCLPGGRDSVDDRGRKPRGDGMLSGILTHLTEKDRL